MTPKVKAWDRYRPPSTITHAAFPLLVGYKLVHRASKAAVVMVRAMHGLWEARRREPQECEGGYQKRGACTQSVEVRIPPCPGITGDAINYQACELAVT